MRRSFFRLRVRRPERSFERRLKLFALAERSARAFGPYLVLMKWNPGWFSAPHSYATDRIQMVLSGTWWVNSGEDFDPKNAVTAPAGTFVKRAARTFHYDGVPSGIKEPVVIAIFGMGPVDIKLADPKQPSWRRV
jgi:hypothetical protein